MSVRAYMRGGAYTWSLIGIKEKVGLSAGGFIGGEIRYLLKDDHKFVIGWFTQANGDSLKEVAHGEKLSQISLRGIVHFD